MIFFKLSGPIPGSVLLYYIRSAPNWKKITIIKMHIRMVLLFVFKEGVFVCIFTCTVDQCVETGKFKVYMPLEPILIMSTLHVFVQLYMFTYGRIGRSGIQSEAIFKKKKKKMKKTCFREEKRFN